MTRTSHPWLALVLVIVLILTGQTVAVTRGAAAATGQMELCIGAHVVTVYVDAEGNPTAPPHVCPDCVFAALTAWLPERDLAQVPDIKARPFNFNALGRKAHEVQQAGYHSRAPPVMG